MMRDLDASSPVVWPPWCYSVDIKKDIDLFCLPKSRRSVVGMQIEHPVNNNTTSNNNNNNNSSNNNKVATAADVKTERLSPAATAGDSASSRSGTPSSSCYPGTPPSVAATADRVASPAPNMINRNCSDLIRSLAAKYQNANPSEYLPSRNGLNLGMLSAATAAAAAAASGSRDDGGSGGGNGSLFSPGFPFATPTIPGTNVPMFPPMMDMTSAQALFAMVRSTQHLDAYMTGKPGGIKRPCSSSSSLSNQPHHGHNSGAPATATSEQNPLDLSSSSSPCKKPRKGQVAPAVGPPHPWESAAVAAGSFAETFLNMPAFGLAMQKSREKMTNGGNNNNHNRRLGSISPKASPKHASSACRATTPGRALHCASSCAAAPTSTATDKQTCPNAADKSAVAAWTVDDVCDFVETIDLCAEYSKCFRDQSIDGTALPLLSEDHLTGTMNMKLGPALKFRAVLAQKLGNCAVCMHCAHCHGAQSHGAGRHSPSPGRSSSSGQS